MRGEGTGISMDTADPTWMEAIVSAVSDDVFDDRRGITLAGADDLAAIAAGLIGLTTAVLSPERELLSRAPVLIEVVVGRLETAGTER